MSRTEIIVLAFLLTACQSISTGGARDENSRNFSIAVGSRFVLNETVTIPAEELGAYFQYGKIVSWQNVRRYAPYCVLQRDSPDEQSMTIQPDVFVVTNTTRARRYYLPKATPPLGEALPAALSATPAMPAKQPRRGGNYSATVIATILEIHSAAQPAVRRFMCTASGRPEERFAPSVREIREALQNMFTLELPAPTTAPE
jgi:hypothetical protein